MAAVTNATPLISLDAVVIDTETTGLDPRKARVIEIGAVRLVAGRIEPGQTFRSLVQMGEKIPAKVDGPARHRRGQARRRAALCRGLAEIPRLSSAATQS